MEEIIQLGKEALVVLEKLSKSPNFPSEVAFFLERERASILDNLDAIGRNSSHTTKERSTFRFSIIGDRDAVKLNFMNAILIAEGSEELAFMPSATLKLICAVKIVGTKDYAEAKTNTGVQIPLDQLTSLVKATGNKEKKEEFGIHSESEILLQWPEERSPFLQENVEVLVFPATVDPDLNSTDVVIVVGTLATGIDRKKLQSARSKAPANILLVYDADLSAELAEDPESVERTRKDMLEFAGGVFFIDLKKFKESKRPEDCGELKKLLDCLKDCSSLETKTTGAEKEMEKSMKDAKSVLQTILNNLHPVKDSLVEKRRSMEEDKSANTEDKESIQSTCDDIIGLFDSILGQGVDPADRCYERCCPSRCLQDERWELSVEDKMVELQENRRGNPLAWCWQAINPCAEIDVEKEENLKVTEWYCETVSTLLKEKILNYIDTTPSLSNNLREHLRTLVNEDNEFLKIVPSDFHNLSDLDYSPLADMHFYSRNSKFTIPVGVLVFLPAYVALDAVLVSFILALIGGFAGLGLSCLVRYQRNVSKTRVQKMNSHLRRVAESKLREKLREVLRFTEGRSDGLEQRLCHATGDLSELNNVIDSIEVVLR